MTTEKKVWILCICLLLASKYMLDDVSCKTKKTTKVKTTTRKKGGLYAK
jgi:hypothetical protein